MGDENKFDPKKFSDDLHDRIHQGIYDSVGTGANPRGPRRPIIVGIHLGRRGTSGLVWGALLFLVGVALLLDHMGIIYIDRLWRFWPLLLVCAGIPNVMRRENRFWGVALIAAGAILQLNELGIAHFRWNDIWPILLILGGLTLMWGALEARRHPSGPPPMSGDPRTTLEDSAIFSGVERRVTSQDFQGGRVTAIFGGVELDLSDANIQGDEAAMEINAIFGGIELRIPETWQVAFRGTPIFGGISDKTRAGRAVNVDDPSRKVLVLTGAVIFGGVEIKN
jgi:predicted membrane protein